MRFASTVNEGRKVERLSRVSEDVLGDGTCGFAKHVGEHIIELKVGDGETVLSAVPFVSNHIAELGTVTNQIMKLSDTGRRNRAGTDHAHMNRSQIHLTSLWSVLLPL